MKMFFIVILEPHLTDLLIEVIFRSFFYLVNFFLEGVVGMGEASE